MLHDGTVERRKQHVVFVVEFRNRNDEQSVILSDVAIDNRGTRIGSRAVSA
jgi:hypothetical protein